MSLLLQQGCHNSTTFIVCSYCKWQKLSNLLILSSCFLACFLSSRFSSCKRRYLSSSSSRFHLDTCRLCWAALCSNIAGPAGVTFIMLLCYYLSVSCCHHSWLMILHVFVLEDWSLFLLSLCTDKNSNSLQSLVCTQNSTWYKNWPLQSYQKTFMGLWDRMPPHNK